MRPRSLRRGSTEVSRPSHAARGRRVIAGAGGNSSRYVAGTGPSGPRAAGGLPVAERVEVMSRIEDESHARRPGVSDVESHAVVTVVEVLSPANNSPGSR